MVLSNSILYRNTVSILGHKNIFTLFSFYKSRKIPGIPHCSHMDHCCPEDSDIRVSPESLFPSDLCLSGQNLTHTHTHAHSHTSPLPVKPDYLKPGVLRTQKVSVQMSY